MKRLTTQQIADLLGVELWRVQRLYELKLLPEPERFGGRRAILSSDLPAIVDALRRRGWLKASNDAGEGMSHAG